MVDCPICSKQVKPAHINDHIDSNCVDFIDSQENGSKPASSQVANFFKTPATKRDTARLSSSQPASSPHEIRNAVTPAKRSTEDIFHDEGVDREEPLEQDPTPNDGTKEHIAKRSKPNPLQKVAPLAERMRPKTLDDVSGQELVGRQGVLRGLIESDRVPSMILWGGPGTGKTSIARVVATMVGSRFVEINSTSTGVAECKKIFSEARSELTLTGRKTIIFCDEIHRFTKTQQDVFLGPVETGIVTLIGATTENPSFKIQSALLSRCRTFTLQKLADHDICQILQHALEAEVPERPTSTLLNEELLKYLASFADGDARTALNLLELSISLVARQSDISLGALKAALTKTLVYDRSGDQHYDTISAFHKSVRGSDPDAALYYLARMIASGEDALYIARRMIVMASEDIGLADNTMLPLAIAAYTACEKVGLPEARINLAHVTVALCLAPKSTRAYRGLEIAMRAIEKEPGVGGLPIPIHLRNAPTRLMKELGYGKQYKYNPNYRDGQVKQEYLPEQLQGRRFLEDLDLGTEIDEERIEAETVNGSDETFDHSFHGDDIH